MNADHARRIMDEINEPEREMDAPVRYALNHPTWGRDRWQATLIVNTDKTTDIPESAKPTLLSGDHTVCVSDIVGWSKIGEVEAIMKQIAADHSRGCLVWWESADCDNNVYCDRSDNRDPYWRIDWRYVGQEEVWGRRQLDILKRHRGRRMLPPVLSGLFT